MNNMTIKWEEITDDRSNNLERVLKLYDSAFPIDIREPHHILYKGLEYAENNTPNRFRMLVGLKNDVPVSFATGHYLADVNCGFIVYLGTDPNERFKGLGSQTLAQLEEALNKDAILASNHPINAFILETERVELAKTDAEKEDCRKRDRFYQKNGYVQLKDIDYVQPPLNGGNKAIPLKLLIKNSGKMDLTKTAREVIYSMYNHKYHAVNDIPLEVLNHCLQKMNISEAFQKVK